MVEIKCENCCKMHKVGKPCRYSFPVETNIVVIVKESEAQVKSIHALLNDKSK